MSSPTEDELNLREEARIFSAYLIGAEPTPALVDRYITANRRLLAIQTDDWEASLLETIRRDPRLVAPIDAALARAAPDSLVRRKILVMAAILEATPDHADAFLPRRASFLGAIFVVARAFLTSRLLAFRGRALLSSAGYRGPR